LLVCRRCPSAGKECQYDGNGNSQYDVDLAHARLLSGWGV
jgi:hypothetical protein